MSGEVSDPQVKSEEPKVVTKSNQEQLEISLLDYFSKIFTRQALMSNAYYIFRMNGKMEIQVNSVFQDRGVKQISTDRKAVISALQKCPLVTYNDQEEFVVPKIEPLLTKIVISDVSKDQISEFKTHLKTVDKLFENIVITPVESSDPKEVKSVINASSEQEAQRISELLQNQQFQGQAIRYSLEKENVYETFTAAVQDQKKKSQTSDKPKNENKKNESKSKNIFMEIPQIFYPMNVFYPTQQYPQIEIFGESYDFYIRRSAEDQQKQNGKTDSYENKGGFKLGLNNGLMQMPQNFENPQSIFSMSQTILYQHQLAQQQYLQQYLQQQQQQQQQQQSQQQDQGQNGNNNVDQQGRDDVRQDRRNQRDSRKNHQTRNRRNNYQSDRQDNYNQNNNNNPNNYQQNNRRGHQQRGGPRQQQQQEIYQKKVVVPSQDKAQQQPNDNNKPTQPTQKQTKHLQVRQNRLRLESADFPILDGDLDKKNETLMIKKIPDPKKTTFSHIYDRQKIIDFFDQFKHHQHPMPRSLEDFAKILPVINQEGAFHLEIQKPTRKNSSMTPLLKAIQPIRKGSVNNPPPQYRKKTPTKQRNASENQTYRKKTPQPAN